MVFNSLAFLVYLPIVILLYAIISARARWVLLLVASLVFYGWWKAEYLLLLGTSVFIGWGTGLGIADARNRSIARIYLITSIVLNIGILFFYKYFGFFASVTGLSVPNILLPIGISFYTFQILSYTIDVWRGTTKVERNIARFALYASFFPQLVAGPIERSSHLLPQLQVFNKIRYENFRSGMEKILFGLFKKVVIADRLAMLVNVVYADPSLYSGPQLVLATIFFGVQIYCDFSGYSDIAIGCAKIFGIEIMENFRRPYLSLSVAEFWTRWHISLSTWFRDYIYIPLGGNRRKKPRVAFNLFVTFLLSGIWHGANWTFMVWGAWHGMLVLTDRMIEPVFDHLNGRIRRFINPVRWLVTLIAVMAGWIFFRAQTLTDAMYILSSIGKGWTLSNPVALFMNLGLNKFFFLWSLAMAFGIFVIHFIERKEDLSTRLARHPFIRWTFALTLLIIFLLMGVNSSESQFIYFQF